MRLKMRLVADCRWVRVWDGWVTSQKQIGYWGGVTKRSLVYSRSSWPHAGFSKRAFPVLLHSSLWRSGNSQPLLAKRIKYVCGCMDALFLPDILVLRDQRGVSFNVTSYGLHHNIKATDRSLLITDHDHGVLYKYCKVWYWFKHLYV